MDKGKIIINQRYCTAITKRLTKACENIVYTVLKNKYYVFMLPSFNKYNLNWDRFTALMHKSKAT